MAAFLTAVGAWIYRASLARKERLIRLASESERAPLVESALEFFRVDTGGLTKEQKYNLVLQQIRGRERRFLVTAKLVSLIALLLAGVCAYAIARETRRSTEGTRESDIEIVDLGLLASNTLSSMPSLDIKLRNRGNVAAFLKKLELTVIDHVQLHDCFPHEAQLPSSVYFYYLGRDTSVPISNDVPAGGVERIELRIGYPWSGPGSIDFFLLQLVVLSDADDKKLVSKPFPVRLDSDPSWVIEDPACIDPQMDLVKKAYAWRPAYSLPSVRLDSVVVPGKIEFLPDGSMKETESVVKSLKVK